MAGSVLIIDAVNTNRIVLRVKLEQASYDVHACGTLDAAQAAIGTFLPDAIIAADNLPGLDAATICTTLREMTADRGVPLIVTTSDHDLNARLAALAAGADEVLERPLHEAVLLSRMRCLIRDSNARIELQMRDDTRAALGFSETASAFRLPAHVDLVSRDTGRAQQVAQRLQPLLQARLRVRDPATTLRPAPDTPAADAILLLAGDDDAESDLNLLPEWRTRQSTRRAGVIVMLDRSDIDLGVRALDLGANDLILGPVDPRETALRADRQIRRKQTEDELRAALRDTAEAALVDPLTGVHNRRYALAHLANVFARARETRSPFSVMLADIDHFKKVNDRYGHPCGDQVLCDISARLSDGLRASDMLARIGGEEFLVVMPDTTLQEARAAALRLCNRINARPVRVQRDNLPIDLPITISIGATLVDPRSGIGASDTTEDLIEAADRALYAAKTDGRNQVLFRPTAA